MYVCTFILRMAMWMLYGNMCVIRSICVVRMEKYSIYIDIDKYIHVGVEKSVERYTPNYIHSCVRVCVCMSVYHGGRGWIKRDTAGTR